MIESSSRPVAGS